MPDMLPDQNDLQRLPMRAIVAYASRLARRLSACLRGSVGDDLLDEAFAVVDRVWVPCTGDLPSPSAVAWAVQRVAAAYAGTPDGLKSTQRFRAVFSLTHASLAAIRTLEAIEEPVDLARHRRNVALEAERAARAIAVLNDDEARDVTEASVSDYNILASAPLNGGDDYIGNRMDYFSAKATGDGMDGGGTM